MEVRGKVVAVQPVQTGEGRNGIWKKQEYVIEYDHSSQFPRRMMFNLWGDKIEQHHIQEGQFLKVSFDIDCREYNGRWYNDLRAWKVEADEETPADASFTPASPPPPPPLIDEASDLPF